MRTLLVVLVLALAMPAPLAVAASPGEEARALYEKFYTAQNARDLKAVEALFWDSPKFLWVSDGMSVWGRGAVLQRMSSFQTLEVWSVVPDLAKAVAVELDPRAAYLHLPLALTLGKTGAPETFHFLVTVLCIETDSGWRIAALLTTTEKAG
jgi:uncharacterized protein (TIGR02246 family)